MHDQVLDKYLQVEINNIAVSFAGMSPQVCQFHQLLVDNFYNQKGVKPLEDDLQVQLQGVSDGLEAGHKLYLK